MIYHKSHPSHSVPPTRGRQRRLSRLRLSGQPVVSHSVPVGRTQQAAAADRIGAHAPGRSPGPGPGLAGRGTARLLAIAATVT